MWISKQDYTALVDGKARAEANVVWLTMRLNQLEHEIGQQRYAATGQPSLVPKIEHVRTVKPTDAEFGGAADFEDVGEDDARRLGITSDESGRLVGIS